MSVPSVPSPGDRLVNPASRETFTFVETTASSGGRQVVVDLTIDPGGGVPFDHVHATQWEEFEVRSGRVRVREGRTEHRGLGPGATLSIPPGVRHGIRSDGDEPAQVRFVLRPAQDAERILASAVAAGVRGRRFPSPADAVQLALVTDTWLPVLPVALQRVGARVVRSLLPGSPGSRRQG